MKIKLYIEYIDISKRENNNIALKENNSNKESITSVVAI